MDQIVACGHQGTHFLIVLVDELRICSKREMKAEPGFGDLIRRLLLRWRLQNMGHRSSSQFAHGFSVYRSSLSLDSFRQLTHRTMPRSRGIQVFEHGLDHLEVHHVAADAAQDLVSLGCSFQSARL